MDRKRAISPLIATVILITLTIAVGAMLVGFATEYVKRKVKCISYELSILDVRADYNNNILRITVANNGLETVKIGPGSPLMFYVRINGTEYYCEYGQTVQPGGCIIQTNIELTEGAISTIDIKFGSGIDLTKYEQGEFMIKGCGIIGETIYKYKIR